MKDTRRYVRMLLTGTALVFATVAGGTIGYVTAGGSSPLAGSWEAPPATIAPAPSAPGSAAPSADPAALPDATASPTVSPTLEPTAEPTPEPTAEPTLEPTPTLAPLEVETPLATPLPEPTEAPYVEYVVQSGDILNRIAQRFGVTTAAIIELNPQIDPESLVVGEILLIPQ